LAKSNGDARRLIEGGGISLDGEKISDVNYEITFPIKGDGVIKAGKRRFIKIIN
jgi:tyrosyl-tRNA synthetase